MVRSPVQAPKIYNDGFKFDLGDGIQIWFNKGGQEHVPPHVHAWWPGMKKKDAEISISERTVIEGEKMPHRVEARIRTWMKENEHMLMEKWNKLVEWGNVPSYSPLKKKKRS